MATREENLKKINDELEKLSDDELEKIASGTRLETYSVGDKIESHRKIVNDYGMNFNPQ